MTTFNTNTNLNSRNCQLIKARAATESQVWWIVQGLTALFTLRAVDPAEAIAKVERREAARRSVDNLLR